jgi:hypothetical protein
MNLCILFCCNTVPYELVKSAKTDPAISRMIERVVVADMKEVIPIIEEGYPRQLCVAVGAHLVVQVV